MDSGFQPGEDAARYDEVSAGVEEHSHLLRPLVQRLISFAGLHPGERLLDMGCGTGVIANQAARRVGPRGRVVGLDISTGMLARAKAEAFQRGMQGWVTYVAGDAEVLPLANNSIDCATCLFTFMHLPRPLHAVRELHRVLNRGGRAIIGVGSSAPRYRARGLAHLAGRVIDRIAQRRGTALIAPDLLNSLVKTHFGVAEAGAVVPAGWENPSRALTQLLTDGGFGSIRYDWGGQVASFADPEEFWDVQNTCSSFARQRLLEAPPEQVARIREQFLAACESVIARGGQLLYPIGALFVSGVKTQARSPQADSRE